MMLKRTWIRLWACKKLRRQHRTKTIQSEEETDSAKNSTLPIINSGMINLFHNLLFTTTVISSLFPSSSPSTSV